MIFSRALRRHVLLAGVSTTALMILAGESSPAMAGSAALQLSPSSLAAAMGQRSSAAASTGSPLVAANVQAQLQLSAANVARAVQALQVANAAQATASASAQLTLNNVPLSSSGWNGTPLSGLNPVDDTNPALWVNAQPLQKNTATQTATVTQTAANALLTWQSFDLNVGETLVFNQQGNTNWTVLNRIVAGPANADGSRFVASPSYILGSIRADGAVYVINPNGIIFGGQSQINVHSLIASALDIGAPDMTTAQRDAVYMNNGLFGDSSEPVSFSYNQNDEVVEGNVVVNAGASIATTVDSSGDGGFVYFFAPNVSNAGSIATPLGETMMAAAQTVFLTANAYPDGGILPTSEASQTGTFRATGFDSSLPPTGLTDTSLFNRWRTSGAGPSGTGGLITSPGTVTNTGIINADEGVVILNGDDVTQGGVVEANTGISRNGWIFLDARFQLTLTGNSASIIMPDATAEANESIPLSALGSFSPGQVELSGNTIEMQSATDGSGNGALILAPGGNVAVNGISSSILFGYSYPETTPLSLVGEDTPVDPDSGSIQVREAPRFEMDPGSTIDVSGLDDVVLPMSANLLTFQPFGNEFADQPLQRDGALRGQSLTVDLRDTGTINGTAWVGTPLADLMPYLEAEPITLDQLLTTGGTVKVAMTNPGEIVTEPGSIINVAGGYVQYQSGAVATTDLVSSTGEIVDIADASPLQTYIGVAGVTSETFPKWGASVSETFMSPLMSGSTVEPGYVQGSDAGGITLSASSLVLGGSVSGGVIVGELQAANGERAAASTANSVSANPQAMPTAAYFNVTDPVPNTLTLTTSDAIAPLPSGFTVDSVLPSLDQTFIATDTLSAASLGEINLHFLGDVDLTQGATLAVTTGGSISLTGNGVDLEGSLVAHSGSITILASGIEGASTAANTLTVGANAVLDASGLWVNDSGASAETLVGAAYINGGAITLQTAKASVSVGADLYVDTTGNIVFTEDALADGSTAAPLLDVSSGGRIAPSGAMQLASDGVAVGTGGSISLLTYVGTWSVSGPVAPPTVAEPQSTIETATQSVDAQGNAAGAPVIATGLPSGLFSAFGFTKGGTLSVQVPAIQIGGAAPDPGSDTLYLPASFFAGNAFGAYSLTSIDGGITVAAGSTVTLQQDNLIADPTFAGLATGANIASVAVAAGDVGLLPEILRSPVNLALTADVAPYQYSTIVPGQPDLLIGEGAAIVGDPQASISLTLSGRVAQAPSVDNVVGNVTAETAQADILGTLSAPGGTISVASSGGGAVDVWLGADSVLNVSGVTIADLGTPTRLAGSVLAGGRVSIALSTQGSALVGEPGASILASGTEGQVNVLTASSIDAAATGTTTTVWSNAGAISLAAPTILYDGSFTAAPGSSEANGGSLTIQGQFVDNSTQAGSITVQQSGDVSVAIGSALPSQDVGVAFFSADQLDGSGIANLTLAAGPQLGDVTSGATAFAPGTVTFLGNVTLGVSGNFEIDGSTIAQVAPADGPSTVALSANYFDWLGTVRAANLPAAGTGVLTVSANTIDLGGGALADNAEADFISAGDLRLRVPLAVAARGEAAGTPFSGELLSEGNITLQAAQIYPVSDVNFTVKSLGADATITIAANGTATAAPLSVGGAIALDAAWIVQSGTLVAPLGLIQLGAQTTDDLLAGDPTPNAIVVTANVTLTAGSVTSVSLAGLTVPFGETTDGTNLSYDASGVPLPVLPSKHVNVSAGTINLSSGATVDLEGGGTVYANEFVQGTGGTVDVLDNPNTYAIVPGYNPAVAPIDFDFLFAQGNTEPAVGSSVFLSGGNGLAAGTYTLLPAYYATLPGAYTVTAVPNTLNASSANNMTLGDGTQEMAGYLANPSLGTRNAQTEFFDVQSSTVWRQYSEIDTTNAATYFASQAQSAGETPQALPQDAGQLTLDAFSGFNLAAQLVDAAAAGGRGAEVDIAAENLQVVAPGTTALSGFVTVSADQLSDIGADTLILGAIADTANGGATMTAVSDTVVVDSTAADPLSAPEIMIVTKTAVANTDPQAAHGLTVGINAVIEAEGTPANGDPLLWTIGSNASGINGAGAFLAVTNGSPLILARQDVHGLAGTITIDKDAILRGNSVAINANGTILVGNGIDVTAQNIFIGSRALNFGAVPTNAVGFRVPTYLAQEFGDAQTLTLDSTGAINFYGNVTLGNAATPLQSLTLQATELVAQSAGAVTLNANTLDWTNPGAEPAATTAGTASLVVNAGSISFGSGDKALGGFDAVSLAASNGVTFSGTGSLDAGAANVNIASPIVLVDAGAIQSLTTTGAVTLTGAPAVGTPVTADDIGGTLSITAASIGVDTLVQATAGGVTLEATSGNLMLGGDADILANGFVQSFFTYEEVASAGDIELTADSGNIIAQAGARLDVSSASGFAGNAGSVSLSAANGDISLNPGGAAATPGSALAFDPAILASTVPGDSGGSLTIDAQTLDGGAAARIAVPSVFSNTVNIHVASGDILLNTNLTASNVTLTADQGSIVIDRTIDASGAAGGTISLYGGVANGEGVTLANGGALLAQASSASETGGAVILGTETNGTYVGGRLDSGTITISAGSIIDVSNTANAGNDGTVLLRAPAIFASDAQLAPSDIAIAPVAGSIVGASTVTVEGFKVFSTDSPTWRSEWAGVIDPANNGAFFGTCTAAGVCSGTLLDYVQNFAIPTAAAKFGSISPSVLNVEPGVELVNNDPNINGGNITVASVWNLGAGLASTSTITTTGPNGTPVRETVFDAITQLFYRTGHGSPTGEPGFLTLRATSNVVIDASISDGFFQTGSTLNNQYLEEMQNWVAAVYGSPFGGNLTTDVTADGGYVLAGATYLDNVAGAPPPPVAPYEAGANAISPRNADTVDPAPLSEASLFPLVNGQPVESWSYRIVAGSDTASANPLAVQPLSQYADGSSSPQAGEGNVIIDKHVTWEINNIDSSATAVYVNIPTMVRTGTGSIDIAAARDFELADTSAPGVVYTAGRNSVALPSTDYAMETVDDPLNAGGQITLPVAQNPYGFMVPQVLTCDPTYGCDPYGPITAAAYPVDGGHLSIFAQQDILGYQQQEVTQDTQFGTGKAPNYQFFAPWLLSEGISFTDTQYGAFSPLSAYVNTLGGSIFTPTQTSWWINFGSFDQGVMAVGGNVSIVAGRNIDQLSVSLPTTGRVSGGQPLIDSAGAVTGVTQPVLTVTPSGNLTVVAGGNIYSGAFYEGSGTGKIVSGGTVTSDWASPDPGNPGESLNNVATVLAVDTGTISLVARDAVDIGAIVSGASLQNVEPNGISVGFLSTFGPDSAVTLQSVSGDVTTNSLATTGALVENQITTNGLNIVQPETFRYPANFSAISLLGDVDVADAIELAPSNNGNLDLLAYGSLNTYIYPATASATTGAGGAAAITTGVSLIEQTFNPLAPNQGFGPPDGSTVADLGPELLHAGDTTPDLFLAVTGDISSGYGDGASGLDTSALQLTWQITKPALVQAGVDIVNLSFFGQNLAPTDVTSIIAGRDIFNTDLAVPQANDTTNETGLSLAGPGFFDVEAGRNLGPFVTAAADLQETRNDENSSTTDGTGTGIITFGNQFTVGNLLATNEDESTDPFATRQNFFLPHEGADIMALFGVGPGIDYQAVLNSYVDPTPPAGSIVAPRNYLPQLYVFLQTLGLQVQSPTQAWTIFETLTPALQKIFAEQVVFDEIQLTDTPSSCCTNDFQVGYAAINTLFPASMGYTNDMNGSDTAEAVSTGNLDLLHATIKTTQSAEIDVETVAGDPPMAVGGDVYLLGPGGSMDIGSIAEEPDSVRESTNNRLVGLSDSALGIMTLDDGTINIMTDENVSVNQSRILTVDGGNVLIWSSNGNIDAGRGSKTTVDFEPLEVDFDPYDYSVIDLNGLVTGAGIGTIQATEDAPPADAFLVAARGVVNFGDAGARSSGNITIAATEVLNAANLSVHGTATGIPQAVSVNLASVESSSSTSGGASESAEQAAGAAAQRGAQNAGQGIPSLISVQVLSYGDCQPGTNCTN